MSQAGRYLSGTGAAPVETLTGNVGGPVGPDGAGNINVLGGNDITVTGNPGTNTLTIDLDANLADTFTTDAGNAVPAAQVLNILGADGIATSGAGNTVTVGTDGTLADTFNGNVGSATPVLGILAIVGGTDITTTAAGSTVTIDFTGTSGMLVWNEVFVIGPTAMAVDNGYIANNAGQVVLTLPAVAAQGSIIRVTGKGAGGWQIAQNAGQTIFFGNQFTTTGAGGMLVSTLPRDTVELVCVTANNDWNVLSSIGNITVV